MRMLVEIEKSIKKLTVYEQDGCASWSAPIALGREPTGHKQREGDGRTPEGEYRICLCRPNGRHGESMGISYPSVSDAASALADGRIDDRTHAAILLAHAEKRRPPWGSPLGGEIYIHAGGTASDWTQGCIALEAEDMARLYALRDEIECVRIKP